MGAPPGSGAEPLWWSVDRAPSNILAAKPPQGLGQSPNRRAPLPPPPPPAPPLGLFKVVAGGALSKFPPPKFV